MVSVFENVYKIITKQSLENKSYWIYVGKAGRIVSLLPYCWYVISTQFKTETLLDTTLSDVAPQV